MNGDLTLKLSAVAIIILLAMVFHHGLHATHFNSDGTSADWDEAVRLNREAGQPAVVIFTAGWCPACQALHRDVLSQPDVHHELYSHYTVYTVDLTDPGSRNQSRARKFGVSAIPQLIRYDKDGDETDRANYMDPDDLIAWLKDGE